MQPKVSIIVPVYNTEKYLEKCLNSLVNQTLGDVQVVVIDDGSKDSSPEIIRQFQDKYPEKMVCIRKENGGQASARNMAFALCEGEYIGFLDSDDYVSVQMFEKMYCKAKETDADYVACGYTDVCEEDGKIIVLKDYVASKVCKETKDMFFDALVSPFLHLYRAEILKKTGVMFPEGLIYEDTAFYINLIPYIHKVACIEEALAFRMRHSNSTTTTISASRVAQIFGVIDCVQQWYQKDECAVYMKEKEYMCARILLGSSMERISRIDNKADRKRLIRDTFAYLEKNYPNYKKNPYFKGGMKNAILRFLTKATCPLYVGILRLRNSMRKDYQ